MLQESAPDTAARVTLAFRLVLTRSPRPDELAILIDSAEHYLQRFKADTEAASRLVRVGESRSSTEGSDSELAAYTAVAGLILNLDESLNKE